MRALVLCLGVLASLGIAGAQGSAQAAPPPRQLETQLLRASERGDAATVRVLLRRGAHANAAHTEGNTLTALMLAARGGHETVLRLLLDAGAKVEESASVAVGSSGVNEGVTALMLAASSGNVRSVKLLLDRGANPNARAVFKTGDDLREAGFRTVAMHASSGAILELLGDRGTDLLGTDAGGNSLLFRAAAEFDASAVRFLLKKGVDPRVRNRDGETALDWAKRANRDESVKVLEAAASAK